MLVAAYIEKHPGRHQDALWFFDYLVISQIVPTNPAAPVKGPTHVVKRGKTPVLSVEDARTLLDSIPTDFHLHCTSCSRSHSIGATFTSTVRRSRQIGI